MPVLENEQVSLSEALEVQGVPLLESQLWGVLHQTVDATRDIFLSGKAYKDGIPQHLVTPESLLCTSIGRIVLKSCSLDDIKGTCYWCSDMELIGPHMSDLHQEKIYVYTIGQTLKWAAEFGVGQKKVEQSRKLSPLLKTLLQAMHQEDPELRMILSDVIQVCGLHASKFTSGIAYAEIVKNLHKDVLGSFNEAGSLNEVSNNLDEENEQMFINDIKELLSVKRLPHNEVLLKHVLPQPDNFHAKDLSYNAILKDYMDPKHRWEIAIAKIRENCHLQKHSQRCNSISKDWRNHKAQNTMLRVYEELNERRTILELLKSSVSTIPSLCVMDKNNILGQDAKPKTLKDIVLLLQHTSKQSLLCDVQKTSSIDSDHNVLQERCEKSFINNRSGTKISPSSACPQHSCINHIDNFLKASKKMYYSLDSGNVCDDSPFEKKKIGGPEFVSQSLKPNIPIILLPKQENKSDMLEVNCLRHITVVLLNGQRLDVTCNLNSYAGHIFHAVAHHLSLNEHYLFGLAFLQDGEFLFLDSHQQLKKVAPLGWSFTTTGTANFPAQDNFTLYLRVKYSVDDVSLIRFQETKHQYYLQLRKDILEERICCDPNIAATLAGLALQAEFGDYDKEALGKDYYQLEHYLPSSAINQFERNKAKEKLTEFYISHKELSTEMAELKFINEVQRLPEYGYHFHKALKNKYDLSSKVWIGISINGLKIYEEKSTERYQTHDYQWSEIKRISFTKRYFCLMPRLKCLTERLVKCKFFTTPANKSQYLFNIIMSHHQFFTKLKSKVKMSELFFEDLDLDTRISFNPSELLWDNAKEKEFGCDIQDEQNSKIVSCNSLKNSKCPKSVNSNRSSLLFHKWLQLNLLSNEMKENPKQLSVPSKLFPLTKYDIPSKLISKYRSLSDEFDLDARARMETSQVGVIGCSFFETDGSYEKTIPAMQSPLQKVTRKVLLRKDRDVGFGLIITCGDTYETVLCGAFVEAVLPNGPADIEGTLCPGDQILQVNGEDVTSFNYLDVVDIIQNLDQNLELVISKSTSQNDHAEVDEVKCIKMKTWRTEEKELNGKTSEYNKPPVPKPRKKWAGRNNSSIQNDGKPSLNGEVMKLGSNCRNQTTAEIMEINGQKGMCVERHNYLNGYSSTVDGVGLNFCDKAEHSRGNGVGSNVKVKPEMDNFLKKTVYNCQDDYEPKCNRLTSEWLTSEAAEMENEYYNNENNSESKSQLSNNHSLSEGEVFHVVLEKSQRTLGLNLCQGKNKLNLDQKYVYIHSIVPGGSADKDGRIFPGDILVEVNGTTLDGLSYHDVISLIRESPDVVHLVLQCGARDQPKMTDTASAIISDFGRKEAANDAFVKSCISSALNSGFCKDLYQQDVKSHDDGYSFPQSHSDYTSPTSSSLSLPQACFSSGTTSPGSPSHCIKEKDLDLTGVYNSDVNEIDDVTAFSCRQNIKSRPHASSDSETKADVGCHSWQRNQLVSPICPLGFKFDVEEKSAVTGITITPPDYANDESDSCSYAMLEGGIRSKDLYTQLESFLSENNHEPYGTITEHCTSKKSSPTLLDESPSSYRENTQGTVLPAKYAGQESWKNKTNNASSLEEQRIAGCQVHHRSAPDLTSSGSFSKSLEEGKEAGTMNLYRNKSVQSVVTKIFKENHDLTCKSICEYDKKIPNYHPSLQNSQKNYSLTEPEVENLDVPKVPQRRAKKLKKAEDIYRLINKDNTFSVVIRKSSRGIGLSIYGGKDASQYDPLHHLIRIRKLFPLQPASECGELQIGDIILEVNGKHVLGLTNTEALEMLRAAPSDVILKVCRPDESVIPPLSTYVKDDSRPSSFLIDCSPGLITANGIEEIFPPGIVSDSGEFEITLMKTEGSLGFAICKKEESPLGPPAGIYIKELIREPAKSDGRVQPGDRILQVNGTEVSSMTHSEAIKFLRSIPQEVTLKLFRCDPPLSPGTIEDEPCLAKPLRKEAIELLSDRIRNKEENNSTQKRLGQRRMKNRATNDSRSSTDSESNSSSGAEVVLNSSSLEHYTSEEDIGTEGPGLQRNQRPKSLDVLNTSDRKQRLSDLGSNNDDAFHRQASVMGTSTEPPASKTGLADSTKSEKGGKVLLKWRGTTLTDKEGSSADETIKKTENSSVPEISCVKHTLPAAIHETDGNVPVTDENPSINEDSSVSSQEPWVRIVHVELDRGWHGRLGFSLGDYKLDENEICDMPHAPIVTMVHPNSLAARDGRIKVGDRIVQVNSETVEEKPSSEVIDILRKTKGVLKMIFARLEANKGAE